MGPRSSIGVGSGSKAGSCASRCEIAFWKDLRKQSTAGSGNWRNARNSVNAASQRSKRPKFAEGRSDSQLVEAQRNKTYALRDRDIAGVRRLSANELLEDENGGRIAPKEKLDRLVDALALDRSKRTIVTCGSGVSASGAYLALLDAGFTDVAVYDGSWLEWSHDGLPTVAKP